MNRGILITPVLSIIQNDHCVHTYPKLIDSPFTCQCAELEKHLSYVLVLLFYTVSLLPVIITFEYGHMFYSLSYGSLFIIEGLRAICRCFTSKYIHFGWLSRGQSYHISLFLILSLKHFCTSSHDRQWVKLCECLN